MEIKLFRKFYPQRSTADYKSVILLYVVALQYNYSVATIMRKRTIFPSSPQFTIVTVANNLEINKALILYIIISD